MGVLMHAAVVRGDRRRRQLHVGVDAGGVVGEDGNCAVGGGHHAGRGGGRDRREGRAADLVGGEHRTRRTREGVGDPGGLRSRHVAQRGVDEFGGARPDRQITGRSARRGGGEVRVGGCRGDVPDLLAREVRAQQRVNHGEEGGERGLVHRPANEVECHRDTEGEGGQHAQGLNAGSGGGAHLGGGVDDRLLGEGFNRDVYARDVAVGDGSRDGAAHHVGGEQCREGEHVGGNELVVELGDGRRRRGRGEDRVVVRRDEDVAGDVDVRVLHGGARGAVEQVPRQRGGDRDERGPRDEDKVAGVRGQSALVRRRDRYGHG